MVDAANRGWRESNGLFSKITVEKKILPVLNEKLGCQITHSQYLSRLKWFKTRYTNYSNLMRFNSAFGWDPITKRFIAPNEVWEEYFKSHPSHTSYCTHITGDYEDLRIAVGNGAIERHSIGLRNDSDARTNDEEESKGHPSLEDAPYDFIPFTLNGTQDRSLEDSPYDFIPFTQNGTQDRSTLPSGSINLEVPLATKRNTRNEFEDKSTFETSTNQFDVITQISHSIEKLAEALKSFDIAQYSCWNLIKELPDLDKRARSKALVDTIAKKIEFVKMTPQERYHWIAYKLEQ